MAELPDAPAPDLLSFIRPLVEKGFPFVERMGLRLDHVEPGRVRMTAPLEGNGNHINTMYAGALFTLAEIPGGALFLATFDATRYYPIIKGMEIKFVALATTDITVEASLAADEVERVKAEAEERGKADFDLAMELKDTTGRTVCVTTNHYQARRHGT